MKVADVACCLDSLVGVGDLGARWHNDMGKCSYEAQEVNFRLLGRMLMVVFSEMLLDQHTGAIFLPLITLELGDI